jgi:hypothetical protein
VRIIQINDDQNPHSNSELDKIADEICRTCGDYVSGYVADNPDDEDAVCLSMCIAIGGCLIALSGGLNTMAGAMNVEWPTEDRERFHNAVQELIHAEQRKLYAKLYGSNN